MKKVLLSIMVALLLAVAGILVINAAGPKVIGQVLTTDIRAYIDGAEVPAYNIDGNMVVVGSDLRNYGFNVVYDNNTRTSSVSYGSSTWTPIQNIEHHATVGKKVMDVYSTDIKVLVNGKEVQAYNVDNKMAFKFSELKVFGEYKYDNSQRASFLQMDTSGGKVVTLSEVFGPVQTIKLYSTECIRGEEANRIMAKDSSNKTAGMYKEWVILSFAAEYLSVSETDPYEMFDLSYFLTWDLYYGGKKLGLFDTVKRVPDRSAEFDSCYVGECSTASIAFMVDKGSNLPITLKIKDYVNNKTTDFICDGKAVFEKVPQVAYYSDGYAPTYTSITGVEVKERNSFTYDYVYKYTSDDDLIKYHQALFDRGYTVESENGDKITFEKESENHDVFTSNYSTSVEVYSARFVTIEVRRDRNTIEINPNGH